MAAEIEYVLRVGLDRSLHPWCASVTAYVDEKESYRVVPQFGPFDTWEELLTRMRSGLDNQMHLW